MSDEKVTKQALARDAAAKIREWWYRHRGEDPFATYNEDAYPYTESPPMSDEGDAHSQP